MENKINATFLKKTGIVFAMVLILSVAVFPAINKASGRSASTVSTVTSKGNVQDSGGKVLIKGGEIKEIGDVVNANAELLNEAYDGLFDDASAYSNSKTYKKGDLCTYNGNVYMCTTEISTPESFTESKWRLSSMTSGINSLNKNYEILKSETEAAQPTLTLEADGSYTMTFPAVTAGP